MTSRSGPRGCLVILLALAGPPRALAADVAHPTVVELFQSQGCSSCPPANANLLALASRPDVLALSWQVTYWDHLGWTDTFGKPEFTERQRDYARAFHRDQVFTPEIVVNGQADVVGNRRDELDRLISRADRGNEGPSIALAGSAVTVSAAPGARVLLVRYDPALVQVPIARGENGGLTLPHRNVVRELVLLGVTDGQPGRFRLPPASRPGLRSAVLVQAGLGGPILAAARE
ncbi:DUF1223 domain-containing protein [Lichenicoccus sp.]|uniref:DUF1223 domain-containing protein n=1 Tax=Lichenicoccus sp. TaxID=2781899 RepID=UPI003D14C3E6